jgi:acetyl-CoA carboxylase carboxyl transferase subunit beta
MREMKHPHGRGDASKEASSTEHDMAWFTREKPARETGAASQEKNVRTEGLWLKCDGCRQIIWRKSLEETLQVCPKCDFHFKIGAAARLRVLFDGAEWTEHDRSLTSTDPLGFVDSRPYNERLAAMRKATSLRDAIISAEGRLNGRPVDICSLELKFIGGSVGAVVGEVLTRAVERSIAQRRPLIVASASGGMRMQEGMVSLVQMAKISAALMRLDEARLPYISILTDPTTGGTTASFAMLGDLNIAEPGALIGFAGPRVIEQTIRQKLPEGFQRSEFLLSHGFVDAVVRRPELKGYIARALDFFCGPVK